MAHDRFSPLLLADGEVLLDDVAAEHAFVAARRGGALPAGGAGRLKVASRALLFDPDDWRRPVVRIPLDATAPTAHARRGRRARSDRVFAPEVENGLRVSVRQLVPWRGGGRQDEEPPRKDAAAVVLRASGVALLRENGVDHPYVDAGVDGTHYFYPRYGRAGELHELVAWLQRVNALPARRDRERAIRGAVAAREARVRFDIAWLEDAREKTLLDEPCSAVFALSHTPGRVCVTDRNIYFMPIHGSAGGAMTRLSVARLQSVRRMRHGVRDGALEISYVQDGIERSDVEVDAVWTPHDPTLMLAFKRRSVRERAVELLVRLSAPRVLKTFERVELDAAVHQWRAGDMSNFQYLLFLNLAAGRSFNDLSQYPVFPWVLADYRSAVLDLSDPRVFRDLSKPIGALEPMRKAVFEDRYKEMPAPRFHYGTHYSTPAYVINYLVRAAPAAMLRLQNGRFDAPDRLFNSVPEAWDGVSSNQTDLKELIPEFYAVQPSEVPSSMQLANADPSEFLENRMSLSLGVRQDGRRVDNVELPAWANGSAIEFLERHRDALECMHVSYNIHHWIDLIFGVNARNPEACNVFYTDIVSGDEASESADEPNSSFDADRMSQLETVLLEFGRTPMQLFQHPHPPRFGTLVAEDVVESGEVKLGPPTPAHSAVFDFDSDGEASNGGGSPSQSSGAIPPLNRALLQKFESAFNGTSSSIVESSFRASIGEDRDYTVSEYDATNDNTDTMSVSSRATSSLSVSERRSSVIFDKSSTYLSKFLVDDDGMPILKDVAGDVEPKAGAVVGMDGTCGLGVPEGETAVVLASVSEDEWLRVYVDGEKRRSRHIAGIRSLACGDPGTIFVGTANGCVSLYSINSGRVDLVMANAHHMEVTQMVYSRERHLLVTASLDATIRVWKVENEGRNVAFLSRFQELDAEDSICHLTIYIEGTRLYVACLTEVERILAWSVDMTKPETFIANTIPVFEHQDEMYSNRSASVLQDFGLGSTPSTKPTDRCQSRLAWVVGSPRKHMLAVVHRTNDRSHTVRLWKLRPNRTHSAEIALPDGREATCLLRGLGSGTVFVGGEGCVAEFDRTGFCLHSVICEVDSGAERRPVSNLTLLSDMLGLLVRVGDRNVSLWESARD